MYLSGVAEYVWDGSEGSEGIQDTGVRVRGNHSERSRHRQSGLADQIPEIPGMAEFKRGTCATHPTGAQRMIPTAMIEVRLAADPLRAPDLMTLRTRKGIVWFGP